MRLTKPKTVSELHVRTSLANTKKKKQTGREPLPYRFKGFGNPIFQPNNGWNIPG